ncbi:MAG: DUF3299 domain-containing protein [Chloroflexi bacterium]|nr:DUF3299 domain-containing protein [Chloroflexota bacterium]
MMIFSKQTKRNELYIFYFLIIFLTVSCSSSAAQPETNLSQVPPTPASGQPVEYGASLSEWEEATQDDLAQIGSNSSVNSEPEQPLEPAPTVTLTAATPVPQQLDDTAVSPGVGIFGSALLGETSTSTVYSLDDINYQEIMWDALIPVDFTADAIMAKYEEQLGQFEDGSPESYELYTQMQEEFNNAPINELMDGSLIRLPGFIAPLEYTDELITEFLLVPYFGACIHVPPPPANQTVLVTLPEGQGIKFEDAYSPFWIMGQLTAEEATTDLAEAGYYIDNALFELYSDES